MPMKRLFPILCLFLTLSSAVSAGEKYPRDISNWQENEAPSESDGGNRAVWSYATNYSSLEWCVFMQDGIPSASEDRGKLKKPSDRPGFIPQAGRFKEGGAFAAVDDGWLVAFNEGEFGAALYWFSRSGKNSYKISDHQIVDFFSMPDGICAIEGLAHLTLSEGSVIRIKRPEAGGRWQAITVTKLPFAPYAVSVRKDGTMLITLSQSLVSVGLDGKVRTLLEKATWPGLYPNSSVLQADERRLYIGMRQFVGEFDLEKNKFRYLIPSKEFLNKLPAEDEARIRKQYSE